jgi:phenylacetate-CoA ligase
MKVVVTMITMIREVLHNKCYDTGSYKFSDFYKFLKNSQWWTSKEIENYQNEMLLKLLTYANKTKYYNKIFKELNINIENLEKDNIKQVLKKIPILTKSHIRNNFEDLIVPGIDISKVSSGGSTGEPITVGVDKYIRRFSHAIQHRNLLWAGARPGSPILMFWGSPADIKESRNLKNKIKGYIENTKLISSFDITSKTYEQLIELIETNKYKVLIGYASALVSLANYIKENNITIKNKINVVSSAEVLYENDRKKILETFGKKVFNRYGCREFGDIAHECEYGSMHINVEHTFVEVVEIDSDNPTQDIGRLIITPLTNYGMPLLRYEIGDLGKISFIDKCLCGRNFPTIDISHGRIQDILKLPNGKKVSGAFVPHILKDYYLTKYQLVQYSPEDFLLIYRGNLSEIDKASILEKFNFHTKQKVNIRFSNTEEFIYSPSGKFRSIITKM